MNDLVLEGFVNNFAEARGLLGHSESEVFEAFVASSLLRKYHQSDTLGMEDEILVGGGGDGGMDALVILINGRPISTEEGMDFLFDSHGRLDVEFVFIQAKTSSGFSSSDIGNYLYGVEQFFASVSNSTAGIRFRPEIEHKIQLTRSIYGQVIRMQDSPKCFVYYATAGEWTGAEDPQGRFDYGQSRLSDLNLFSEVYLMPVDANLLKTIYRELERGVVKEVEFIRAAAFPRIDKVDEAYIGL